MDGLIDDLEEDDDDDDNLYFPPNMNLNGGDTIVDGIAVGDVGETLQAPATIPTTGNWSMGEDGGAGVSENGILSEEEIDAILDSQILDLSECMTELDDMIKTTSYR